MGRPPKLGPFPNRLREIRVGRGVSLDTLGSAIGRSGSAIARTERGIHELRLRDAEIFARYFQIDPAELFPDGQRRLIPIVGYVGAGAQVFPIDDHERGAGLDEIECPPELNPEETVAVIVRGDSMPPMTDGWRLFYSRKQTVPAVDLVGQLCVVQVANDGPMLVKQLRRGPTRGHFNLVSGNAPLIEDAEIEWAARVQSAKPGASF